MKRKMTSNPEGIEPYLIRRDVVEGMYEYGCQIPLNCAHFSPKRGSGVVLFLLFKEM